MMMWDDLTIGSCGRRGARADARAGSGASGGGIFEPKKTLGKRVERAEDGR